MLKLGIIGYHLEHSLSPQMHTFALQHLNIKGEYKAYEIKENEFENKIKELIKSGIKGFNVTIPYKTKIISLLDELTERAKLANAVNTVTVLENGKTIGDNTDVIGFWEAIPDNIRKNISNQNVSILGCGGSANAVVVALLLNKANSITVYGRNKEKLANFLTGVRQEGVRHHPRRRCLTPSFDLLKNIDLSNTNILINTTPVGMFPNINESPISVENLKKLPKDAFVYDLIYNPKETKLLKEAKSLGFNTVNGLEMLVRQGAESLKIWLHLKEAPVGVMRLSLTS